MSHRWRIIVAVIAVVLLSAPSALGVQRALEPTRGSIAAWLAALGIELAYLSTILLSTTPALAVHARRVALVAVASAIVLNVVADYASRQPDALMSSARFVAQFDVLHIVLSIIESAPLAGLAYALATLTHRVASEHAPVTVTPLTPDLHPQPNPLTQPDRPLTPREIAAAQKVSLRQAYRILARAQAEDYVKANGKMDEQ